MAPLYETLFLNFIEIEKSLDGAEPKGNQQWQWLYFVKEQNYTYGVIREALNIQSYVAK